MISLFFVTGYLFTHYLPWVGDDQFNIWNIAKLVLEASFTSLANGKLVVSLLFNQYAILFVNNWISVSYGILMSRV